MASFGRYRIVKSLGAGAAGGVYLVEDRVLGGELLALKRVEAASDPSFHDSLAREFAVLASLSMQGVAPVHDLGVMVDAERGLRVPFITRAYVDGEPLDRFAARSSLRSAIQVMLRVIDTVARLHKLGVIHGDIKPANVIVDGEGRPSLIDFGLATRGLSQDALQGSGTPAFMAPELFRGQGPARSTDIYALGATLWCIVTGHAPLEESGPRALSLKLRGELPRLPPGLSPESRRLLEVALGTLADDARQRPKSADELAAAIERASGEVVDDGSSARIFVPPRVRGREDLLRSIETNVVAARSDGAIAVLHGPRGIGKSTLLRELKWRLELRGARVVEVRCGVAGLSPVEQLLRQTSLTAEATTEVALAFQEPPTVDVHSRDDATRRIDAAARALGAQEIDQRVIVLVDDIDRADLQLPEALRLAVHGEDKVRPIVVATSETRDGPVLQSLGADTWEEVSGLPADVCADLVRDCLGPVDVAAMRSLIARVSGNPGVLIEALSVFFERPALTVEDVERLSLGAIGETLSRARLTPRSELARTLLSGVAATFGTLAFGFAESWLGPAAAKAANELVAAGLVRREGDQLLENDPALSEWLRADEGAHGAASCARAMLASPAQGQLDVVTLAQLALVAADVHGLVRWGEDAARALAGRGATANAARLLEAVLRHATGAQSRAVRLELIDNLYAMGEYDRAAEQAHVILEDGAASAEEHARARVVEGRACVLAGRLDVGIEVLRAIDEQAPNTLRVQASRELARAYLRRGAHEQAKDSVLAGLSLASESDLPRAELLAIDGTLFSMAGDHEAAHRRYGEAIALARKFGAKRDEAQVLGYAAFGYERAGEFERARTEYEHCIEAARAAGDVGLTATYAGNLGNVSFRLGLTDSAEENYTLAARLSRRAGRVSTALIAANNLVHLHVYMGLYERARRGAEHVIAEAQRLGQSFAVALATNYLGDADARTHDTASALSRYEASASAFKALGRSRELSDVSLDAAEALLDRAGASDVSAASAKLAQARDLIDAHALDDCRLRLRYLLARARAANGDVEGAERELDRLSIDAAENDVRELGWQVRLARALTLRALGSEVLAAKCAREAAEGVEALATRIPRDARDAFRADPRRRAALELAESLSASSARSVLGAQSPALSDPRFDRLLEIIKRLARELDLSRLLERITDAAVELSGAERGFVLLLDERRQLVPHTVRGLPADANDPHVAFSRSIAEAVLIDGEPMITVNARDDRRVNEFMSVHQLMLKSVAALPINGPSATLGVLYLEHRLRAGRFQEADLELLVAFADQAAIALENARLWAENMARRTELEEANRALSFAKDDIERLLAARTEELERVTTDLSRATAALSGTGKKYGLIGQSASMRRVFALIERVQDSTLPVVIQGESGTGKELVARAIHVGGVRQKGPFVAINCAALPETLLESELFGHVRGAFTGADRDKKGLFAQAHGGTLFLDEFADMPMRMQVDLLRVLQEGKVRPVGGDEDVTVDVRVIAASNRSLQKMLVERRLREDLYYRLSVVEIHLPPLRERNEDIPVLCEHFLARLERKGAPLRLSRAALDRIIASGLPGNVRQLEHLLTSAAMMCDGNVLEADDLPLEGSATSPMHADESFSAPVAYENELVLPRDLDDYKGREKERILAALSAAGWNRARAAKTLGMPRRTFYRRLEEYEIL